MNGIAAKSIQMIAAEAFVLVAIISLGCSSSVDYTPPAGSREMAITHYSFGQMVIDGKTYESDLSISADKTVKKWRMRVIHFIDLDDIRELVNDGTRTLIIGIGAQEVCSVSDDVSVYLISKGVELHVLSTDEAVKLFNATPKKGLAACFHLNC